MAAKFVIKTYELCEPSFGCVGSFLLYIGQGMGRMNQFMTAETNKTAVIVVKLSDHLLGHGHIVWMDNFYNSPELAQFMKYKIKQTVLEL
jgi:hypothetical protein